MFKKFLAFTLLAITSVFVPNSAQAQNTSLCGNVMNGAILNFAWECWNDATFLMSQQSRVDSAGWQYVADGGVNDFAGAEFEIYGMAFRETANEVFVVINSNLPFDTGYVDSVALNGTVAYGDVFLNLTNLSFLDAMNAGKLFGIRFDSHNDSSVPLGVYKNVIGAELSSANDGPGTREGYQWHIATNGGGTAGYGDFPTNMTYFPLTAGYNDIASGQFLGPVTLLTSNSLIAAGFNMTHFAGVHTVGFKFQKSLIIDECGVVGGDGSSCTDCAGIACGQTAVDQCGVCGGNGTSCLDCSGTPNGQATVDRCGVCGGDGTSCLDCSGTPGGQATIDQCGVCGGDGTSCLDCSGTPNGEAIVDQCGVCGGNGTSCLDCSGQIFGTKVADRCGVCGGDGQSCLGCTNADITDKLFALDGNSARQSKILIRAAKDLLRKAGTSSSIRKFAKAQIVAANKLHVENWTLSWALPQIVTSCTNTSFCVSVDNSATLSSYNSNSNELYSRTSATVKRLRKAIRSKSAGKNIIRSAKSELDKALGLTSQVPATASKCN